MSPTDRSDWQTCRIVDLTAIHQDYAGPLLRQVRDVPLIVGTGAGGSNALCPQCGEIVLLSNVMPDSVYDFAISCYGCGAVAAMPSLPAGRGVGGIVQSVPLGQHIARDPFVADCDQVFIGVTGLERRAAETGVGRTAPSRRTLDISGIEQVLSEAREVFDPILPQLLPRFRRNPQHPHRLPELLALVEANLAELESGSTDVDVIAVLDLARATWAFARWSKDPNYERLIKESKHPSTFLHNTLLLMVASVLADAGLGPELVPTSGPRTPDLRLRISAREHIDADVKAPVALQRKPGVAVRPKEAGLLVADALRSSRGQLDSETPSLLVIGGSFWTGDFDQHARAAAASLRPDRRRNLVGVILASTSIEFARVRGTGPFEGRWEEVDWLPGSQSRWVANPGYALPLALTFSEDLSHFEMSFRPD